MKGNVCQICKQEIWEERWDHTRQGDELKNFICFHCFENLRDKQDFRRRTEAAPDTFMVCDRCGEASDDLEKVGNEWICRDCL